MGLVSTISNLPIPFLHSWGYLIIILASILEAVPLIGVFIPGHSIVILGGFFAKLGVFNIWMVMVIASLGAIVGDLIGYFIGHQWGYAFINRYGKYFYFRKKHYQKLKKLMHKHTGKAIIFGRFNLISRAFAPFIAGLSKIPFGKFLFYNIIGGVSWAVSSVAIGFIFGVGYEIVSRYFGFFIAIATIIGLSLIYVYRFINNRKHIFAKYHPYILALNIISIYTLSKMIEDVVDNESIIKLDTWINVNIVHLWNPLLNLIMIIINNIFTPTNTAILCIGLLAFLIYKKNWHQALVLFFTLGFASLTDLIIEPLIHRIRPENAIISATGYSFPSGHTILATIFFTMLIYSFKDKFKGKAKIYFILFNILMIVLIGFDRVYLNVHWFSDTIAGLSIALFWFTFTILAIHILVAIRFKIIDLIEYKSAERLKKINVGIPKSKKWV